VWDSSRSTLTSTRVRKLLFVYFNRKALERDGATRSADDFAATQEWLESIDEQEGSAEAAIVIKWCVVRRRRARTWSGGASCKQRGAARVCMLTVLLCCLPVWNNLLRVCSGAATTDRTPRRRLPRHHVCQRRRSRHFTSAQWGPVRVKFMRNFH
jgi:hypothetical protein